MPSAPGLRSTCTSPKGDRYAKATGAAVPSCDWASADAISRSKPWICTSLSGSRVMGRIEPFCISEAGFPTASWRDSARCSCIT
jgi:hypothetical protein